MYQWKQRRERAAFLALANGAVFRGWSFGAPRDSVGEAVFNTGMYDKILRTLPDRKYTAVIAAISQVHAVTAALIDSGVTFPGECSVVAIGDRMEVPYYRPDPARVVVPHQEHARLAFELVKFRAEHPELPPQHKEVHPFFVKGQTLSPNFKGE